MYFDATRKKASEGGFSYTLEWLKQYQKYKECTNFSLHESSHKNIIAYLRFRQHIHYSLTNPLATKALP